jgi:hypothetical protein
MTGLAILLQNRQYIAIEGGRRGIASHGGHAHRETGDQHAKRRMPIADRCASRFRKVYSNRPHSESLQNLDAI